MVLWSQEEIPLASDLLKHKSARGILGVVTQVDIRLSQCPITICTPKAVVAQGVPL